MCDERNEDNDSLIQTVNLNAGDLLIMNVCTKKYSGCQQLTIKAEFDRVMIDRENEIYLDKLYYIHPANFY